MQRRKRTTDNAVRTSLVVAGMVAAMVGCGSPPAPPAQLMVGQTAPDFRLEKVDGNGDAIRYHDFGGKAVLIDFWATWCQPCRRVSPMVAKIKQQYEDKGLMVIGVTNEPSSVVKPFLEGNRLEYDVFLDPGGSSGSDFKVKALPTLVLIDQKGTIRYRGNPLVDEAGLEEALKQVLGSTPNP